MTDMDIEEIEFVPDELNFTVYRGDSFRQPVRLREKLPNGDAGDYADLTGCEFLAQIRVSDDDPSVLVEIKAEAGDDTGEVVLSLPKSSNDANNTATALFGVWDLQVTWPPDTDFPEGETITYLRGAFVITTDVSRGDPQ